MSATSLPALAPSHESFNVASMRTALACLSCFVAATLSYAAGVEFVHVWPGWREAESFEHIGEFLGGREHASGEVVLRTHVGERAGFYFLVRVANATAASGAQFELRVIRGDSPEPKTFLFPVTAPAGESVFELGLTGADWPGGAKAHPVAWKLALLSADGRTLAEQKSFLWEKPAK